MLQKSDFQRASASFSTRPGLAQCPLTTSAEQSGNELLNCKCWRTLRVCARVCPHFFPPSSGAVQSVHLREWAVLHCLGKTLSVLHTKPSPFTLPLSFSLTSLQQLFSCLSWELEPGCFSPCPRVTSRNSPTYRHTQTQLFFCPSLSCPTLVWPLTVC